jgi:hypothetical protein
MSSMETFQAYVMEVLMPENKVSPPKLFTPGTVEVGLLIPKE